MRRRHLESVSVRSTDDAFASFVSSTASDRKGFVKGESVPLTVFWFLLYAQKERHGGEPYRLCLCKRQRDAEGDHKLAPAG